jgi:hypothetical protein
MDTESVEPVQPEPQAEEEFFVPDAPRRDPFPRTPVGGIWASGGRIAWVAGLVLMLSSFMGWYAVPPPSLVPAPTTAVIGWHTGVLGKLIFFLGLALIVLAVLREFGIELPPSVPESLIVIAVGAISTIFVLIRLISIPDEFQPGADRGIGIWIALIAALAVIFAGLLRAGEEL